MPRINHNIDALLTNAALKKNGRSMSKTLEKLSTGLKINRSSDDAAGLSVSEQLRGQMYGLGMGNRNIQDGISVLNIAEGALTEVESMLQRMRELSVEAATGTLNDDQRQYVQVEIEQLCTEIDRVANATKYNKMSLLNGDRGTPSNPNPWGNYMDEDGNVIGDGAFLHIGPNTDRFNDYLNIQMIPATSHSFGFRGDTPIMDEDPTSPTFGTQIGTDPDGLLLDLGTQDDARAGIAMIDEAINTVNSVRAKIGAQTNRLEHALTNQKNMLVNVTEAEAQIRDTDFAEETTNFTLLQVLQQSSTSMLSQANAIPNNILSLLKSV